MPEVPDYHPYPVTAIWSGGRQGEGVVTCEISGHEAPIRVPTEFNGPGGATNPEELLVAAVAGCYSITFGIVAENRKMPIQSFELKAEGRVEKRKAEFVFTTIVLRPHVTLAAGADEAKVQAVTDLAHKVDGYCLVTNAIRGKLEILIEPTVVIA